MRVKRHLWLLVALLAMFALRSAHAQAPVTVGIIDSGVNVEHPHFAQTQISSYDATGGLNPRGTADSCLHGTGMAGLVVDQLPAVRLLNIQASWHCGLRQDHMAHGIDYAVEHGADIVLITSGSTYDHPPYREAVSNAVASGVLVVVSAGNSGDDEPLYPAAYDPALTVAAHDLTSSSYGPWVDMAAQGYRVRVPFGDDQYLRASGTSVSAAIVAGQAARLWAQYPDLTLDELTALLYSTLVDVEPSGWDEHTGHGRLDVRRVDEALGVHYLSVPYLARD